MKPTEDNLKELFSKIKYSKEPLSIDINGCNYLYDPHFGKFFKLEKCDITDISPVNQIMDTIMKDTNIKYNEKLEQYERNSFENFKET